MAVLCPSAAIADRWNGALQARLMRAPLEAFLKSRGIVSARRGVAQDTDDVTRAAVHIIETARVTVAIKRPTGMSLIDEAIVGHVACIVTRSLARLICKPDVWRVAALLSTAQLLSPRIGLNAAALASAAYVRRFESEGGCDSVMDAPLAQSVANAVATDCAGAFSETSAHIAWRLSVSSNSEHVAAAES